VWFADKCTMQQVLTPPAAAMEALAQIYKKTAASCQLNRGADLHGAPRPGRLPAGVRVAGGLQTEPYQDLIFFRCLCDGGTQGAGTPGRTNMRGTAAYGATLRRAGFTHRLAFRQAVQPLRKVCVE